MQSKFFFSIITFKKIVFRGYKFLAICNFVTYGRKTNYNFVFEKYNSSAGWHTGQ